MFKRKKKGDDGGEGKDPVAASLETSPQKVGVVSGVLVSGQSNEGETPFGDIVSKRFGPDDAGALDRRSIMDQSPHTPENSTPSESPGLPPQYSASEKQAAGVRSEVGTDTTDFIEVGEIDAIEEKNSRREHLRSVSPLYSEFSGQATASELEVDPMAMIGRATTITGDVVAEEDLEIHGTIEGSVRLASHQVTVGAEGIVKASVEAKTVLVVGKITGDVVAGDLVEVKPGGVVGGDVKAPRVIMHDGAVVVGGLDMSASLPKSKAGNESREEPKRPKLKKVESIDNGASSGGGA